MKTNGDHPAFPATEYYDEKPIGGYNGLTKREYFAAMAMQAFVSAWPDQAGLVSPDRAADYGIRCADELIKKLKS